MEEQDQNRTTQEIFLHCFTFVGYFPTLQAYRALWIVLGQAAALRHVSSFQRAVNELSFLLPTCCSCTWNGVFFE